MERALWLCGIVLPNYAAEFNINKSNKCGWISGLLHMLEENKQMDISLCFPIYDRKRMKDGYCCGHKYYTFHCKKVDIYDEEMVQRFEFILDCVQPDLIHIWGSESSFSTAMLCACKKKGLLNRAIVSIQGLTSVIAKHYYADIPEQYVKMRFENMNTIEDDRNIFDKRGKCEIETIKMLHHIIGRTDWDKACIEEINPAINYYFCDEILRDIFYSYIGKWQYDNCEKYTMFVSQATYPVKGLHYLLQAMPIIIRKYPRAHLYVAGKNIIEEEKKIPYAYYLEELIKEYDLTEHITFVGSLEAKDMIYQYLRANVFVSASCIENSSNSLNEAMLIGTPSVASYVGGTNNRMTTEVEGFLYPHNEPALLAYYICKFFENYNDICTRMSINAVKKMSRLVDRDANLKRTLEIYDKILKC